MGVELKPCPWCGRQPTEKVAVWSGARAVCCTPCFTGDYSVKEWSDRPLEDALRARAEAAEQRAEAAEAALAATLDDVELERGRVEALEGCIAVRNEALDEAHADLAQVRADARPMVAELTVRSGLWQSCTEAAAWYAIRPDHEVIAVLSRAEITAVIHRCAALPSIRPAEWAVTGESW